MFTISTLNERQCQIARLVATGASNKQIARQLSISEKTVKNTLTQVFAKTGLYCRTELAIQMIHAQYQFQSQAAITMRQSDQSA